MSRFVVFLLLVTSILTSCSKDDSSTPPPVVIPDIISGVALEIFVTPTNITTPNKGVMSVNMSNIIYKVEFNAVAQSQSNAVLLFVKDTILIDQSREFANLGKDAIAYNPLAPNEVQIKFYDGRKVFAVFGPGTSFGGEFGETLIAQWREPADPAKPTKKAKDDISNFVKLYADMNGAAPGITPVYLAVTVTKP
jgi:hypothetical protein